MVYRNPIIYQASCTFPRALSSYTEQGWKMEQCCVVTIMSDAGLGNTAWIHVLYYGLQESVAIVHALVWGFGGGGGGDDEWWWFALPLWMAMLMMLVMMTMICRWRGQPPLVPASQKDPSQLHSWHPPPTNITIANDFHAKKYTSGDSRLYFLKLKRSAGNHW